jgi:ABC-2 type transport system permease protein
MNTMSMKWLLRREFWEHKGSMFWAPAIVGALLVLFVGGTVVYGLATHGVPEHITINGEAMGRTALASAMPSETKATVARVASGMYIGAGIPLFLILAAVAFSYCLGALYNERRDRSILFWKSLPVSDAMTVLSKALTALVVAPVITIALATVASLTLLLVACFGLSFNGVNMFSHILTSPDLYLQPLRLLGLVPVYVVWALPTVGWLLLVSSWARSKPMLWALGVPLVALLLVKWISYTLEHFNGTPLNLMHYANGVVAHLLGGIVPGIWFTFSDIMPGGVPKSEYGIDMGGAFAQSWMSLATVDALLCVLAGAAMIFAAMRLRRWRDEG